MKQQRTYFQENSGNGDSGGGAAGAGTTGTDAASSAPKEKTILESVHDELSSIVAGIEAAEHNGVDALQALIAKIKAAV